MARSSKPIVFDPYGGRGRRRSRRGFLPHWLWLLLLGIALGAGGVVLVQERYLPPRLSPAEAAELTRKFERAEGERRRLEGELQATAQRLAQASADKAGLAEQLAASRAGGERLRNDLTSLIEALPADPRGGKVEVRAADFSTKGNTLAYEVVFTREAPGDKPLAAVMQLVVAGQSARGAPVTTTLDPVALSIGTHQVLRGSATLPEGFKPRQATIRVLDRPDGKLLGMRVMLVR
jgi:hypothetical protein